MIVLLASLVFAADPAFKWSDLLSRDEVGATAWSKAHPQWDGRGVVIAVLDTGVDPTAAGMTSLPDGSGPKVIVARDFTGQGAVALAQADPAASGVTGLDELADKPRDGAYWIGFFDEAALRGSSVDDINGNGHHDDKLAVVAFERGDGVPVMVVDTDGDRELGDELVRRSYADEPKTFTFARADRDPQKNRAPVAIAPHLDWAAHTVELHFDDGGHGSHCAGIAAGYRIDGKQGLDGIAPGAQVMSLKIGHGGLAGGATTAGSMTKAIRFAAKWARDHQRPLVINMSYGIGSEREGYGAIDKILDDELLKTPWLAISLSGSNEGPGLSNVGMPASSVLAWSSAAMLPEGNAKTLLGANTKGRKIFAFSSRGGELDKPNGLAPGIAWSTMPPFAKGTVMSGTSMASPQVAGVHALLASAALQTKLPWTNGLAHRALTTGAKPIAGYSSLDQGAGLVNVGAAWEAYQREAKQAGATRVAGWRVQTPLPSAPGRVAQASYWRVGRYLPSPTEAIPFTVTPLLYTNAGENERAGHVDTLTLDADVGWLSVDRGSVALRGTASVDLIVNMDADALDAPGIHVGRIRAKTRGVHAFDLPVVVVVPHTFGAESGWSRTFESTLAPGDIARVFVAVPPGATSMTADILIAGGSYGNVWLLPFGPDGVGVEGYEHHANLEDALTGTFVRSGAALTPGVWELVVYAPYKNRAASRFALNVAFHALDAPARVTYAVEPDGSVSAPITLTNRLDEPFRGTIEATATALTRTQDTRASGAKASIPVSVGAELRAVDLVLSVDDATWERMTDIAVNVLDGAGNLVTAEAFGQRRLAFTLDAPGSYTVEVLVGLADPDDEQPWTVTVRETQRRRSPPSFDVALPSKMTRATLFPGVPTPLSLSLGSALTEAPDGFEHVLELALRHKDGALWTKLELPLVR